MRSPARKDVGTKLLVRTRGGSVDQLRIWVRVEDQKSRRIVEFKQYSKPAIANYQAQPPVHEWLNEIRRTLEIDYRRTKGRICIFRSDRSCEFRAGLSRPARLFQNMNGASVGFLRVTFLSRRSLCMRQSAQRRLRPMTYVSWREDFCRGGFRRLGLALRACSPICHCELRPRGPGHRHSYLLRGAIGRRGCR